MSEQSQHGTPTTSREQGLGYLFGVPVGDLGWFSSLLMSVATGFSAFFLGTFAAIIYLLIYSSVTHRAVDYGMTYRRIGLPIGLLVLAASLAYLGTLWTRRQLRRK